MAAFLSTNAGLHDRRRGGSFDGSVEQCGVSSEGGLDGEDAKEVFESKGGSLTPLFSVFSAICSGPMFRLKRAAPPSVFTLSFPWPSSSLGETEKERLGGSEAASSQSQWDQSIRDGGFSDLHTSGEEGSLASQSAGVVGPFSPFLCLRQAAKDVDVVGDEEGRYLPVFCERLLLVSALSLCMNPIGAFYFGCTYMGYMSLVVFLTSILHWYRPRLTSWRRRLDILVARVMVFCFILIVAATAPPFICALYVWGALLIWGLHALGWHFSCNNRHLEGTICHIGLHIVATASNLIFFASTGSRPLPYSWTNYYETS